MPDYSFQLNGAVQEVTSAPGTSLLHVLRNQLGINIQQALEGHL